MQVDIGNYGSSFSSIHIHVLDASGEEFVHLYGYSEYIPGESIILMPGTYYFVIEPSIALSELPIPLELAVTIQGVGRTTGRISTTRSNWAFLLILL